MKDVLLYTNDETRTRDEIARAGGHVTHVLTPSVLVAELPDGTTLVSATTERPENLDAASTQVADAWHVARAKRESAPENIPWDAPGYEPPC
jgi:hypothetical protein